MSQAAEIGAAPALPESRVGQVGYVKAGLTLTSRLTLAMILLVAGAVFAVGLLSYRSLEQALIPRVLERIETHSRFVAADIESHLRSAPGDVTTFANLEPVAGLVRARLNGGIDPADRTTEATWRQRLEGRLTAQMALKPAYSLRLIGIADNHKEIVRVDRSGPNGSVHIASETELKEVGEASFFRNTINLPADQVYVSPVGLDADSGMMGTPRVPTMQVAKPVFGSDGSPFGIVIVNVDMRPALDRIRASARPNELVYAVDAYGSYLVHPDRSREFVEPKEPSGGWKSDMPYFADAIGTTQSMARATDAAPGWPTGMALAAALLAGKQWVGIVETVPNDIFMAPAATIRNTSLLVGLVAMLCAAVLAIIIARSLTRPIQRLTAAVEDIGRNGAADIPVDAPGETGVLARAFARAIDESKAKSAALEERRRIFETSQDLILISDPSGVLVQVSPSVETILGYCPEEMIGRNCIEFIHPDDLDQARKEMRAARRGDKVSNADSRYIHKDGRAVTLSWSGAWSEPAHRHFYVGRDMTQSALAQETLRESERLARGIIETSLDAFVQMDETGTIRGWNSQAEKIYGWSREEVLGKNVIDLTVVEPDREELHAALGRFLRSGRDSTLGRRRELLVRRRDGEQFRAELSMTATRTRSGFLFNCFVRDLTDKVAAEERIRHSEKMEALGQLTGGIAHDFNNILTVITGTIEILADAVAKEPQLAAITRMIDEAAARGADLTQHLLAFARRQPLQPRETDINTLIIDTAKLLRPTLGEHIEIESAFKDEACIATVDPNQLATAIINLALNSRDAMPGGGKLILETGVADLDEATAGLNDDVRPGRYVMISVRDTGYGIPSAILDRVFDPFFTSKGPGKGTGLGLSMVYGFIKQSAGHIKVVSEEGQGTTVRMYLPPGTRASPESRLDTAGEIEGGTETILVVEDDKLVRDYVLTQLHSFGYATLSAANADAALAIATSNARFDLLFTDIIMPGSMNGRQLADAILSKRPDLKVLFTSGYTEDAVIHQGRLDFGVLLLAKPYRKSDLARMIRRAVDGQT
jgi:PAS domain S-box-containing protein